MELNENSFFSRVNARALSFSIFVYCYQWLPLSFTQTRARAHDGIIQSKMRNCFAHTIYILTYLHFIIIITISVSCCCLGELIFWIRSLFFFLFSTLYLVIFLRFTCFIVCLQQCFCCFICKWAAGKCICHHISKITSQRKKNTYNNDENEMTTNIQKFEEKIFRSKWKLLV